MNITVTLNVQAPELAEAIRALAAAMSGSRQNNIPVKIESDQFVSAVVPAVAPEQPAPQVPSNVVPMHQPPVEQAPAPAPAPSVPTSAQTYTLEQLAVAATPLIDAGRRQELMNLLAQFGVQALTQLPKEQYGTFATQLRAMGAKI